MRARNFVLLSLVALSVAATGCGHYSYRIRRDVDAGRFNRATARCESDSYALGRWSRDHEARYHVYCGIAYLNLGDTQRAQSELVRAEKMRLDNPALIRGRDLAKLSAGLMQLFGVPAGQLEIEVRPGGEVAEAPAASAPAPALPPPVTVVPAPAPPTNAPSVSFSAGASVSPPVIEVPPAPPAVEDEEDEEEPEPPAAPPAQPPVIVIPDEDGAVIQ